MCRRQKIKPKNPALEKLTVRFLGKMLKEKYHVSLKEWSSFPNTKPDLVGTNINTSERPQRYMITYEKQ